MFPETHTRKFHTSPKFLALCVTFLLVLLVIYRCHDTTKIKVLMEAPSQKHVALTQYNSSSSEEEKLEATRKRSPHRSSIPDHLPFLQDFQSAVVSFPWINDSACQNYEVRLGINIPPVYLVSFPRSGNSWTRYLVEGATGIFTGSVYDDKSLFKAGYLGELEKPTSKKVLLIKTHLFGKEELGTDSPALLLIRNPRNAVASYLVFKTAALSHREDKHLFRGSLSSLEKKYVQQKTLEWISLWEQVATKTLANPTLLVLLYEDIKAEPIRSVNEVLRFLKVSPDEGRLQCLAKHVEGTVNRGQPELKPVDAELEKHFREASRRVSELLESRGFAPLPY